MVVIGTWFYASIWLDLKIIYIQYCYAFYAKWIRIWGIIMVSYNCNIMRGGREYGMGSLYYCLEELIPPPLPFFSIPPPYSLRSPFLTFPCFWLFPKFPFCKLHVNTFLCINVFVHLRKVNICYGNSMGSNIKWRSFFEKNVASYCLVVAVVVVVFFLILSKVDIVFVYFE